MSEVTLEAISEVIREELEPVTVKLNAIAETVSGHTGALVEIAKDVKDLKQDEIVANLRFDKSEKSIKLLGNKVGISDELRQIFQA